MELASDSFHPESHSLMPWRCPACSTVIRQPESIATVPRSGIVYRCPVCRLELVVDENTGKLTVAPLPADT
jgi:hypothetical protein